MGVGSVRRAGRRVVRLAALPRAPAQRAGRVRGATARRRARRRGRAPLPRRARRPRAAAARARARARRSACPAWPASIPSRIYHAADRHRARARRRRPALGRRPLDRRPGRQGRRDRRRHRRAARPFLAPAGLRAPAGFPRGQRRFTSGRVIVARSFARPRRARAPTTSPFDPNVSEHGTHVSGILAGAYGTVARPGLGLPVVHGLSGVAPGAWLGNYRGLARGDHESGAIGSTVELAAAVDRAVADGMDVLNLSLGGPQIDPAADALVDGAGQRRARRRPVRRRRGQRLRLARLRLDLLAGHERDGDHGRRDLEHARLRRQRHASAARARPALDAVHGGAVDRPARDAALAQPDAPRRGRGLRARPPRLPRAVAAPCAARRRPRAARRLQLRHEGDQRARGGRAGRDRRERPARAAVRRRGGDRRAAARRDRRRRPGRCARTSRARGARRARALHAHDRRAADARRAC